MKLQTIKLRNFKGIREFDLPPNGEDIAVYGDNGVGKTTIYDAFTWLLFDKDSLNKKDFEIKTLQPNGEPIHNLEHEVEAVLQNDSKSIKLRKVYKEKWVKQRGSVTAEFTGHTTDHYLDDVPKQKHDYEMKVYDLLDEKTFKFLTNPRYFCEVMTWQERRALLLSIGGISTTDLEDNRKIIQAKLRKINEELKLIPSRISENQLSVGEVVDSKGKDSIANALAGLRAQRQRIAASLTNLEAGGGIAEKTKRLREIEGELLAIKNLYSQTNDTVVREFRLKKQEPEDKARFTEAEILGKREVVKIQEPQLEELRERYKTISAAVFEYVADETCPTCGQSLPEDQLEQARQKALENFNLEKARNLEIIQAEGKERRAKIDTAKARIAELEPQLGQYQEDIKVLSEQIESQASNKVDLESLPEYQAKADEKAKVEIEIDELREGTTGQADIIKIEIRKADAKIAEQEELLARINAQEKTRERIEELESQEKILGAEYEKLSKQLFDAEKETREKVLAIEAKVNSMFKLANFKLFTVLINGGIEDCCEVIWEGKPYHTALSNSERINVGLDIINTLSDYYGVTAPIFVDNAEAATKLLETRGQQIRLYVSEADKTLRIAV